MKPETLTNHPPDVSLPPGNTPLVAPIYQSVKFTTPHLDDLPALIGPEGQGFFYSRARNPTVRQLELLLAGLQGRQDALCTGSGVAALSLCLLSLLKAGDHAIMFHESYKPTRYLLRSLLGKFGVGATLLSITEAREGGALAPLMHRLRPRLLIVETPTNPSLRLGDLDYLTGLARACGTLTLLDNTFAGFHNHGQYPVDLFVHSLTKYASGHGDVLGGVVIADRPLIQAMQEDAMNLGATLDPHAAFLILRGMKTYFVRYERQCRSALTLATWLAGQEAAGRVRHVRHPALPSHPQHALAQRQMRDGGAMIAFELPGGEAAVAPFIDGLRLFRFAASLGSTESLVTPAYRFFAGDLTPEEADGAGLRPGAVRLSVGLEDPGDLIADLDAALRSPAP